MPDEIEKWTARHRIAAAAREIREGLRRLSRDRVELDAAIADARSLGVSDEDIADAGRLEAAR